MGSQFFLLFLVTILVTRIFVFLFPIPSPTIGKLRTHHYIFGVAGILVGLLIHSVIIYSIGFGLFIDELTYLIIGGKTHRDNYSKISLFGTLFFVILVFLFRDFIVMPFGS